MASDDGTLSSGNRGASTFFFWHAAERREPRLIPSKVPSPKRSYKSPHEPGGALLRFRSRYSARASRALAESARFATGAGSAARTGGESRASTDARGELLAASAELRRGATSSSSARVVVSSPFAFSFLLFSCSVG